MPHKPKPAEPAEATQPSLFLPSQLPELPALAAAAKQYIHTGKITCKDEERAAAIASKYLETGSLLATARWFHVSPNTVKAVTDVYEAEGKLDDLKQRISRKLGTIIELTSDRSIEALEAGKVPANVLPIMMGVAVEKKALIDGEATQRIEHKSAEPMDAQDVMSYLRTKGIKAPAIDVQSTVTATESKQLEGKP